MQLVEADRLEISDLYARYCHIIDSGDAASWKRVWVDDGVLFREAPRDGVQETVEFRGAATLERIIRDSFALNKGRRRHWITDLVIDPAGDDGAVGRCYLMVIDVGGAAPVPLTSARYEDSLVKTREGWRFRERRIKLDQPLIVPVPTSH
jgi:hypothetical protein